MNIYTTMFTDSAMTEFLDEELYYAECAYAQGDYDKDQFEISLNEFIPANYKKVRKQVQKWIEKRLQGMSLEDMSKLTRDTGGDMYNIGRFALAKVLSKNEDLSLDYKNTWKESLRPHLKLLAE